MKAPSRALLRWHGGKWRLAPWVIERMPKHLVYIEPFGGAASVLLRKTPAQTEVWNDLESEVVSLFRVLREQPDELARYIELTPFAREEFHDLYEPSDDPLEAARRLVGRSFMGQGSKGALKKSGFDSRINSDGFVSRLNSLRALPFEIQVFASRMAHVIIEHRSAIDVMRQYDRPDALFYVDPPYLPETRTRPHYRHELTREDHVKLLGFVKGLEGMVLLSGYGSQLYDRALKGWGRVETGERASNGSARTEVLWMNPACTAALDAERMPLFSGGVAA